MAILFFQDKVGIGNNEDGYNWDLSKKIRAYSEDFFDEYALVLYFFTENHGYPAKLVDIKSHNNDLILYIARPLPGGPATDDSITWVFVLEVKKTDIALANNIKIEIINVDNFEDIA